MFLHARGLLSLVTCFAGVDGALTRAQQELETQPRAPEASGPEFESRSSKDRKRGFTIAPVRSFP